MTDRRALVHFFVPLLLAATGTTSTCVLVTDSSTGEFLIAGTVTYVEEQGGCWRLDDGEGRHYELLPDQAPAELLHDGVRAEVRGQPAEESSTGCQVGLPFMVRSIVSIEPAASLSSPH
jgi:hypothetical protein